MKTTPLTLDLRVGGLGDNWMRLVSFYAAAHLRPRYNLRLILPSKLVRVARHAFGDRLEILDQSEPDAIAYAVLGLRDLIKPILAGQRFASPYGRVVLNDSNRWNLKDRLNSLAYTIADAMRWVYSPPWSSLNHYQGYAEVVTLPPLRDLEVEVFEHQLHEDSKILRTRLLAAPVSQDFSVPEGLNDKALIFPTGTAYQFIPIEWAKQHLPNAVYAFFHRDLDLVIWRDAGLNTVPFFTEPGDMIALAAASRVTASTDSFPSHFLQYCAPRLAIMLTELPRHRVVSPVFKGPVVPSLPPCHPCPHLARAHYPRCKAGHTSCLNWQLPDYAKRIHQALAMAA